MNASIFLPTEDTNIVNEVPIDGIGDRSSLLIDELSQLKAEPQFWTALAKGCLLDGNVSAAVHVLRTYRDMDCKKDVLETEDDEERTMTLSLLCDLENQVLFRAEFQDRKNELESVEKTAIEAASCGKSELLPALHQGLQHLLKGEIKQAETQFSSSGRAKYQNRKNLLPHLALSVTSFQNRDYAKALTYLVHIMKRLGSQNTPMEVRMIIGFCFLEMGKLDFAIKVFKRCMHSNGAKYGLISAHLRKYTNQETHRFEYLTRVLELIMEWIQNGDQTLYDSFSASVILFISRMLLIKGEYLIARHLAEQSCQLADTDAVLADGYLIQARCSHALGHFDEAMSLYSQVLLLKPDSPLAKFGLSQMYIASGNNRNAATSLEQIISLCLKQSSAPELTKTPAALQHVSIAAGSPSRVTSYHVGDCLKLLNVLYSKLPSTASKGKEEQWIEALQKNNMEGKSVHEVPEDYVALGQLVKGKNQVDAFTKALELWRIQKETITKHNRGVKEYNSTREVLMDRCLCGPTLAKIEAPLIPLEVHCNAAAAFFKQYKDRDADWESCLKAAAENTNTALALYSHQKAPISKITLLFNQGRIHEELKQYKEALYIYQEIIKKVPEYLEAHVHVMNVYIKLGDMESAKTQGKESLKLFPSSPVILDLLGGLYLETGNYQRSKECLHSVTKGDHPNDLLALVLLGMLNYKTAPLDLESSSHRQRAKEHYLKALDYFRLALTVDKHCLYAAQGASAVIGQFGRALEIPKLYERIVDISSRRHWAAAADWSFINPVLLPAAEVNLGHLWFLKQQFAHSIKLYRYALELTKIQGTPDDSIMTLIARAQYESHSKFQDSEKTLSQLAHYRPWDKTVKFNLALVLQGEGVHYIVRFREPKALADDSPLKELRSALDKIDQALQLYNALKISPEEILYPLKPSLFEAQIELCNEYKEKGEKAYSAVLQTLKKQEIQDQMFKQEWEDYLKKQEEDKIKAQNEKQREAQILEAKDKAYQEERHKRKAQMEMKHELHAHANQRKRNRTQPVTQIGRFQSVALAGTALDSGSDHENSDAEAEPRRDSRHQLIVEDKGLEDFDDDFDEDKPGTSSRVRQFQLASDDDEDAE
eukprot:g5326.t1